MRLAAGAVYRKWHLQHVMPTWHMLQLLVSCVHEILCSAWKADIAIIGVAAPDGHGDDWGDDSSTSHRMLSGMGRIPGTAADLPSTDDASLTGAALAGAGAVVLVVAAVTSGLTEALTGLRARAGILGVAEELSPLTSDKSRALTGVVRALTGMGAGTGLPGVAAEPLPLASDRSRALILLAIAFSALVIFGAGAARGSSGKSELVGGGIGRFRASAAKESELSSESR